jgi:hypothetical protein
MKCEVRGRVARGLRRAPADRSAADALGARRSPPGPAATVPSWRPRLSPGWCVILAYARAAKAGAALFEAGGRQQNLAA